VWTAQELATAAGAAAARPASGMVEHLLETAIESLAKARDDVAILALRATG
jgi:hypothetical protein